MRYKDQTASTWLLQQRIGQLPFDIWLYRTRASGELWHSHNRTGSDVEVDERPDHISGVDPREALSKNDVSCLYKTLRAHPNGIRESIFPEIFKAESKEWPR